MKKELKLLEEEGLNISLSIDIPDPTFFLNCQLNENKTVKKILQKLSTYFTII